MTWRFNRAQGYRGAILALICAATVLTVHTIAWAAAEAPGGPDGRLAGYIAGLTIAALVGYSIFLCLKPLLDEPDSGLFNALLILIGIWVLKQSVLPLFPGFGVDVGSYQAWAHRMSEVGPAGMYTPGYFLDYPPGYLYALWLVGAIGNLTGMGGEAFRQLTESPSLVADFLLALVVFAYLRRRTNAVLAYAGMLMVALNPAMLFESVIWGQSDSVSTLLMFLCVASVLDGELELGWALAAVGVLVKPQVLLFLPILGLWTLIRADFEQWWRAGLAFIAMGAITAMPFQLGHQWDWLPSLYVTTAAYYHETSVNAFNLIALLGGLRAPDTTSMLGVSCFTFGMTLLTGIYAYLAWILWRSASAKRLFYCTFMVVFGSFMVAPRMHERYVYPALVFLIPFALEDPMMLGVFAVMTASLLFNLAYVKHALESPKIFLDQRDTWAMVASAVNLIALGAAIGFGIGPALEAEEPEAEQGEREAAGLMALRPGGTIAILIERLRAPSPVARQAGAATEVGAAAPLAWIRLDTIVIATLVAVAAGLRFWRLGLPAEIVFDEVHFVGQARHYLHGEYFLDPHPPAAKLLIALGILLFGDHPASWRVSNAILGTALVGITYLLGRRMFHSRLAAVLAAAFVLGDGMFLVDSRIGVLDIVYITFGAWAYLMLFRFIETAEAPARRNTLVWMGLALGLCLASKLYVPAVTFLLVTGFLVYDLWEPPGRPSRHSSGLDPQLYQRVGGAVLLTGAVSAAVYIAVFLPHFILGWWGGIADLIHYFPDVAGYERSVASATHPYSSPWWSWPLMLRPIAYWQNFPPAGKVATIWGGANPATIWGGFTAIAIIAAQALERRSLWRPFILIGYLGYLAIWVPIGRTLFLYHYMASEYLAYFALAAVLAQCWSEGGQPWEHVALILTLAPVFVLGLGSAWGIPLFIALAAGYGATLVQRPQLAGKFTCAAFSAVVLVLFIYYLPIWIGLPIERAGYYARMWLQGPGLRSWI